MASENEDTHQVAMKVLLCGGIAGVATWASVFPLDVIKTRLQAQPSGMYPESRPLLPSQASRQELGTFQMTKKVYRNEGMIVFYRGLGVCSLRAFIVNAVQVRSSHMHDIKDNCLFYVYQWAAYEWLMKALKNNVT